MEESDLSSVIRCSRVAVCHWFSLSRAAKLPLQDGSQKSHNLDAIGGFEFSDGRSSRLRGPTTDEEKAAISIIDIG